MTKIENLEKQIALLEKEKEIALLEKEKDDEFALNVKKNWKMINENRVSLYQKYINQPDIVCLAVTHQQVVGYWGNGPEFIPFSGVEIPERTPSDGPLVDVIVENLLRRKIDFATGKFGDSKHVIASDPETDE